MSAPSSSSSSSQRGSSEGRSSPAPWRRRGLHLQAVPHCRLPTPAAFQHKYELGRQLGRGNFGTVWEARERSSGRTWAAKVVAKSSNKLKMLLLSREIQVLKMVEHPNIVYLREIFETPENVYLILELCSLGELASFCRQRGKLSEPDARAIISGIANAIQYLHKHGIVHRDLKLENVLLASPSPDAAEATEPAAADQPCAKLSDFGLAEVKDKRDHDHMMELFCGTPYCMAPEILSERAYSQQCDVWSMGVILYTLITGNNPYLGGSERDVLYSIHRHPHLQDDPALVTASGGALDLLSRMLHLDPAYRITAAEVVVHPWIMDKSTQASASQDILTLMKEWRIEASESDQGSEDARLEGETPAHDHQQEAESGNTTGTGGEQNSNSCEGGHSGCGGSDRRGCGTRQTSRQAGVSDSDPAVTSCRRGTSGRQRRSSTPLPVRPAQRLSCAGTPPRPRSGPRPTRPAAAGTPPPGVAGRRPAGGGPSRPERRSAPPPWTRASRQHANGRQRTGAT